MRNAMFSVATHFDDSLPRRLAGLEGGELFGACVLARGTHVVCRDLPCVRRITAATRAAAELPVNIGCLLRCPLASTRRANISATAK